MSADDPPAVRLERGVEAALAPLRRCDDGAPPRFATRVRLLDDGERLVAGFECEDPEPRASLTDRDAPLWEEEVVELFVAPGSATPRRYFELQLNPLGAVFDAAVASPFGDRRGMRVDAGWDCPGLETAVEVDPAAGLWRARIALPWRALVSSPEVPERWRLNLFRIDRPSDGPPEFSAWSITGVTPADFHRPDRFGLVTRIG